MANPTTFFLSLSLTLLLTTSHATSMMCNGSTTYRVTIFNGMIPEIFPAIGTSPVVLSPPTVWSQSRGFSAFTLYGYATPGVQDVAETGNFSTLVSELTEGLGSTFVKNVTNGDGPIMPATSADFDVVIDCEHPIIGLDTMVFPSPDWFVGISGPGISVVDEDGFLVDRTYRLLRVYDAGTDSGETLTSEDVVTDPVENIAPLMGAPFFGQPAAAVFIHKI